MKRLVDTRPYKDYTARRAGFGEQLNIVGRPVYRYYLERVWDEDRPLAMWIMLNPSTADHQEDDATIRKVVSFSKTFGMGAVRVLNLYAYRATYPADLADEHIDGVDIVGPENDELLAEDMEAMNGIAGLVIVGWGATKAPLKAEREQFIRDHSYGVWCLGTNADGSPKHPLYLPNATALDRW